MNLRALAAGLITLSTVATLSFADDANRFVEQVQPLLKSKCIACHGTEEQEGGLRLDSRAAAMKGGDSGPALVPRDAEKSLLVTAVRFENPDLQMPPKDRLSDAQIELLTQWVEAGAIWPRPALVLFDDEEPFLTALDQGEAHARFERTDTHRGALAVAVSPGEKFAEQIADWKLPIREQPQAGEFRYLRFAWKQVGGGGAMIEVAREGKWPAAKATPAPGGRYVAGPNPTGLDAFAVADAAPAEWTVVTLDLWKDLGDCHVTGLSLMSSGGGETLFDAFLLAGSIEDLDAWSRGRGELAFEPTRTPETFGTAMEDPRNPIHKLFNGERLDLWSLSPVNRRSLPAGDAAFVDHDTTIDRFIRERLTKAGLKPSPEADRRTLIRRLTFDLTGLPPTRDEVAGFIADDSADAYEKLVDRLLDSPRYGERQARFWLDVVRYADTHGYERDEFRPLIWKYRDYVVRAFNADKPFDHFIREQLAGDEIVNRPPRNEQEADALIATGYLRLGQWDSTASIFQEEERLRAEMMADLTNTTASAFLGLTMSCCQCHDHKYDPLSQADHFRLRAFFAGLEPHDDLVIERADELEQINRHNAELDLQVEMLRAEQAKLSSDREADKQRHEELDNQIASIEAKKRKPRVAMGATDAGPTAPATHVFYQGDFHETREEVPPGFPTVLFPGPARVDAPRGDTTGRRLALANWIASPDNPWTARVIVNRIWQQHFGVGLVSTPNDFGYTGAPPTHPELLDHLAAAFVEDGWSIKRLHRAIVLSNTYRMRSSEFGERDQATHAGVRVPHSNELLWRQNVRRLDAETLRDSLLAVSGLLQAHDQGKPLWPEVPEELLQAQPAILEAIEGKDGGRLQGWYTDSAEATDVRSLFLVRKRCLPIPFLQVFDLPDTTVSCARRDTTVVAPQALMLLNSPSAVRYAEAFADRVVGTAGELSYDDADRAEKLITRLFRLALSRDPDAEELRLSHDLLRRHTKAHQAAGAGEGADRLALVDLCRAVFNLNEFVYID